MKFSRRSGRVFPPGRKLSANILVPQIGMLADEVGHYLNAFGVIENYELHTTLAEEVFRAHKIAMFPDDYAWNAIEYRRSRAHNARTERADQGQFVPVAAASGVADANRFGMRRGIAGLDAQIVSAGYEVARMIDENGTNRQSAFSQAETGFSESRLEIGAVICRSIHGVSGALDHKAYSCRSPIERGFASRCV